MSPFKILYGRDPPSVLRIGRGHSPVDSVEEMLQERDAILYDLHVYLIRSQQQLKAAADVKRCHDQFEVGDMVYLKIQPYRQKSLAKQPYEKLAARFYGPFSVSQRIGQVAYKLLLPLVVEYTQSSTFLSSSGQ